MNPNQQQEAQQPVVPQPIEQAQEQPQSHLSLSKVLFLLLGVFVVVGLMGGAYYLGTKQQSSVSMVSYTKQVTVTPTNAATPTTDPTANWKTYTNSKYKYEIKYPETMSTDERDEYYHYVGIYPPTDGYGMSTYLVAVIPDTLVFKDPAAYDYMSSDWIDAISKMTIGEQRQMDSAATFVRLKDMTVDGVDAVAIKVTAVGYNQIRVYAKENGYIYMISNNYHSEDEMNAFYNFLSTFKFTQ